MDDEVIHCGFDEGATIKLKTLIRAQAVGSRELYPERIGQGDVIRNGKGVPPPGNVLCQRLFHFHPAVATIREVDGTEMKVPAYGRDMQDALSRLVKTERAEKLAEATERVPDYVYALLFLGTLGVGSTLSISSGDPLYFGIGAGALVILAGLYLLRTRR